jgi:DNA-binding NtrC family response regulator
MGEPSVARVAEQPCLAIIIDDDARIRQFIETTLAPLGIAVAGFDTAKEALAAIDRGHPAIIFLDVALLRSDAIDVLRGLGARRYAGIVQLMSGGRPALLEAVQRIGVRHGIRLATPLNKPFPGAAIVDVIENLQPAERR